MTDFSKPVKRFFRLEREKFFTGLAKMCLAFPARSAYKECMSYTETERAAIAQFHAEQGKIDVSNIEELANSLGKSVASVRAVAARAGLYTKSSAKSKTASAEATEIASYISKIANLELSSLANMKLGELQLLRGFIDTITYRW